MAKIKKTFTLEIEVDEAQAKKNYPNYKINFNKPEQMIDMIVADIQSNHSEAEEFGYSVKIKAAKK